LLNRAFVRKKDSSWIDDQQFFTTCMGTRHFIGRYSNFLLKAQAYTIIAHIKTMYFKSWFRQY
ncbi:hypothetical protein ACJX0J_040094, partial [Zea mays]